jgi:alpha-tubulin suppressor-like RCC1 family protein
MQHIALKTLAISGLLVLAACGGGGGSNPTPAPPPVSGSTAAPSATPTATPTSLPAPTPSASALPAPTASPSASPNPSPDPSPTATPTPAPTSIATLSTAAFGGKLQWNVAVAASVTVQDTSGNPLPNAAVTCEAADAAALNVSPNCSSITGKRLGTHRIKMTSGADVNFADVQVIPQRQPFGTNSVAGALGTGGFNLIVTPEGTLLTWGANVDNARDQGAGTLGQGKTAAELPFLAVPTAVKDPQGTGVLGNIMAASTGAQHVLALNEQGQVYSWGCMCSYRLGHGFSDVDPNAGDATLPGLVRSRDNTTALRGIVQVAAGQETSIALADDGTVYTWGNYLGHAQADAQFGRAKLPAPVVDATGSVLQNIVQVSTGRDFALALSADGRIYAWGKNYRGQLGNGTLVPESITPAPYATLVTLADGTPLTGIKSVATGYNFALALTAQGTIYAWGSNGSAQLASGQTGLDFANPQTIAPRLNPELVRSATNDGVLGNIRMVSAGGGQAHALDEAGNVWSWGDNRNGELGDGPGRPRGNPGQFPGAVVAENGAGQLSGVITLVSGYIHAIALKADGTVLLWGDGDRYNLGQGPTQPAADTSTPLTLKSADGVTAFALTSLAAYGNLARVGR